MGIISETAVLIITDERRLFNLVTYRWVIPAFFRSAWRENCHILEIVQNRSNSQISFLLRYFPNFSVVDFRKRVVHSTSGVWCVASNHSIKCRSLEYMHIEKSNEAKHSLNLQMIIGFVRKLLNCRFRISINRSLIMWLLSRNKKKIHSEQLVQTYMTC